MHTLEKVYENAIFQALNPEGKQWMTAAWLPKQPGSIAAKYDIKIAALFTFGVFPHIKTVPTVRMMLEDVKDERYVGKHTIVIDSSGNTGHAVARLARAFGFEHVKVVVALDVPQSKKSILSALSSAEVIHPSGKQSVAERAVEEGQKPGHYHLNQYGHWGNVRAHELYTGPEIVRLLGDDIGVIAVAMGSGGTVTGVGNFFRQHRAGPIVLGVRPAEGERVPGARDRKRMEDVVRFPWRRAVDAVVEVDRKASFIRTRELWSLVNPQAGPTSGLALAGLEKYLESFEEEALDRIFRGTTVGFICPDDGRFYSESIITELDTDQGI